MISTKMIRGMMTMVCGLCIVWLWLHINQYVCMLCMFAYCAPIPFPPTTTHQHPYHSPTTFHHHHHHIPPSPPLTALTQELEAAVQEQEAQRRRAARLARRKPPAPLHLPLLGEADGRPLLSFTEMFPGRTYRRDSMTRVGRRKARQRAARVAALGGSVDVVEVDGMYGMCIVGWVCWVGVFSLVQVCCNVQGHVLQTLYLLCVYIHEVSTNHTHQPHPPTHQHTNIGVDEEALVLHGAQLPPTLHRQRIPPAPRRPPQIPSHTRTGQTATTHAQRSTTVAGVGGAVGMGRGGKGAHQREEQGGGRSDAGCVCVREGLYVCLVGVVTLLCILLWHTSLHICTCRTQPTHTYTCHAHNYAQLHMP